MVVGTTCCGTFVSRQALTIAAVLTGLSLISGVICLGIGLGETCLGICDYDYSYCCTYRSNLIITGGIVTATTVVILMVLGVMSCHMKEVAVQFPPVIQQPHTMYYVGSTTGVYPSQVVTQPYTAAPYPLGNSGNLQQNTSQGPGEHSG